MTPNSRTRSYTDMVTVLATRSPPTTRATRLMPKRTRSLILRARSAKRITSLVVWAFTPGTASSRARATASAFWPGLRATSTAVTFSVPKASWIALKGTKIRLSARPPVASRTPSTLSSSLGVSLRTLPRARPLRSATLAPTTAPFSEGVRRPSLALSPG